MATLTILGLGPGAADLLTAEAVAHLAQTRELWLRTRVHPTVDHLPDHLVLRSFDDLYETASDWAEIYQRIANALVGRAAAGEEVTYAVPGHPLVAEATTRYIRVLAQQHDVPIRMIAGLSFIEPVCEVLALDPLEHGLQLVDALEFVAAPSFPAATEPEGRAWSEVQGIAPYEPLVVPFPVTPTKPVLVCQLYSRHVASALKLGLLSRYPPEHLVTIVRAAGTSWVQTETVELHTLDYGWPLDHLTVAYVPPLPVHEDVRSTDALQWVVARLLGPNGCPWDREQTHLSLRPYLLEEAYEVLEALDIADPHALSEELGDLLLQITMHSEMARQAGGFDLGDVVANIVTKLIRRHPHVFGDLVVDGSGEVLRNWEAIKAQERAGKGATSGLLENIPASLPALATAQKIGDQVAKFGFDWPDVDAVWEKVAEEMEELHQAAPHQRAEEFGDLLFVLTRLASWLHIDAESALRGANAKFRRRFAACERLVAGRDWQHFSPQQLDVLWQQAKQADERSSGDI